MGPGPAATRPLAALLWLTLLGGPAAAVADELEQKVAEAEAVLTELGLAFGLERSVHYHILFVGERDFAEDRRATLELTYRNMTGFMRNRMGIRAPERHPRLLVVLLDTQEQMMAFARRTGGSVHPGVRGYYSPRDNWSVFFNQARSVEIDQLRATIREWETALNSINGPESTRVQVTTPQRGPQVVTKAQVRRDLAGLYRRVVEESKAFNTNVTQHEGAHHIAHNIGVQYRGAAYPFWVSEGLACLFETPPGKVSSVQGAGKTNSARLAEYRDVVTRGQQIGLRELVARPATAEIARSVDAAYAESWAVFEFLFRRHSRELRRYMDHLAGRRPGSRFDEVAEFERHFNASVDELQKEMDKYFERLK